MIPISIEATTLGDAWFQLIYNIFDEKYSHRWNILIQVKIELNMFFPQF
jgi:hypothetical protein